MMSDKGDGKDNPPRPYEVGYGKPPKHSRYKKGQSGNRKGRKPRVKNASTLIQMELDKPIVVRDGEKERQITKQEALITALVNDAITNKPRARSDLLRLLNVSPPPEPFVPNDDDEAALEEFIARMRKAAPEKDDGQDGDEEGRDK